MAKKKQKQKQKYHSFVDEGVRYMECSVCSRHVRNVSDKIVSVMCALCLAPRLFARWNPMEKKQYIKTGRPAGWQWMNEFVDSNGNVFHKGKEVPELKGTLPPTTIKPRKKKKRKPKKSYEKKLKTMAAQYKQKQKIKKESKLGINK